MQPSVPGLLLAALAAAAAVPALPAAGIPAPAASAAVSAYAVPLAPADVGRLRAHWTPQRMAAASGTGRPVHGSLWAGGGAVTATTGKIFFSARGRDYMCSGSTVRSANRDVVITAGHCVRPAEGGWAADWVFVPGYREGRAPYGVYPARRMFVPRAWKRRRDGDHDVALVAVGTAVDAGRAARHVGDVVGAQRIAFGGPGRTRTYAFGYPSTGRYDGEHLAYCTGRPAHPRRHPTSGRGMRCDLTRGSSGGPWLADFDPATGTGTVTTVSSFKFADDGTTMFGPPLGRDVRRAYDRAQHA
ncbi:trypsin-like serine peptidase [Actinomadura parmotrematis]|uniref:Serine protease n=1 Tax=Actinomadura parmotrematis TaxID=2864039 RepID=A0ABS7G273_9ACTN|nr:trypsin-like peptidase domain-containing protein [Actinomadura parmotrematis]MBW8485979.1 serine protease [Actinomadura parmotrematis]